MRKYWQLLPVVLISLALQSGGALAQAPAGAAAEDPNPMLLEALAKVARETLSFAEAVRPAIDRAAFDKDALLDRLGFDDAQLVRFVTEQIAYEPYAGVLRGAHGTLLARAGNALDQSLLLATLLNDAGFEAVIRTGKLPPVEANRLLREVARRPIAPATWDAAAFTQAAAQYRMRLQGLPPLESVGGSVPPQISREEFVAGIAQDRASVLAALGTAGIRLGVSRDSDLSIQEASEYSWVEYRTGPAEPWRPAHVAFGGQRAPEVDITETFVREIPPERAHRLRLELFVDQRVGNEVRTESLMAPMEFPSANVAGQSISLMLLPDTLLRTAPPADGVSLEEETRFLIPLVNQGLPHGARALALNGTTVPPDLIQLSPTGVFETVGARYESAATALRSLGASEGARESLLAIESVRLQLTILQPVYGSRIIERFLYRAPGEALLDPDADATTRRVALVSELARSHSLGFAVGGLAAGYVLDEEIADLLRKASLVRVLVSPAVAGCNSLACLPVPKMAVKESGDNVTMYLDAFDRTMPTEQGSVVYRDAPNVVRVTAPLLPTSFGRNVFDIMANARRAFRLTDNQLVPAPDLVLLAGVSETHIERAVAGRWAPKSPTPLRIWTGTPPLPRDAVLESAMVARALSAGAAVVTAAPPGKQNDEPFFWWEIDPLTGRTLGMTRYGGGVLTEYIIPGTVIVGAVGAVISAAAYAACFVSWIPDRAYRTNRFNPLPPRAVSATWTDCGFCMAVGGLRGALFFHEVIYDEPHMAYVRRCVDERGGWPLNMDLGRSSIPFGGHFNIR